jgi:hypothetical protein
VLYGSPDVAPLIRATSLKKWRRAKKEALIRDDFELLQQGGKRKPLSCFEMRACCALLSMR